MRPNALSNTANIIKTVEMLILDLSNIVRRRGLLDVMSVEIHFVVNAVIKNLDHVFIVPMSIQSSN